MKLLLLVFSTLFSDAQDYFRNFTTSAALVERCLFEAFTIFPCSYISIYTNPRPFPCNFHDVEADDSDMTQLFTPISFSFYCQDFTDICILPQERMQVHG